MTKKELVEAINNIRSDAEDLQSQLKVVQTTVKEMLQAIEDLPSDEEDIEPNEADVENAASHGLEKED